MAPEPRTLLLLGTLDTKGEEFAFARELIEARGHRVILVDAGVLAHSGPPIGPAPEVTAEAVAAAGGGSLGELREGGDRESAMNVMIAGARAVVRDLHGQGAFHGILGMGGGGGTAIATAAMRELPVGLPKLMISTMASGDVRPYVDVKDITMMHSVVDVAGLNPVTRRIIANGVGAVCGMVEQEVPDEAEGPLVAATMFGVTTPCVTELRRLLGDAGYGVMVFHATGSGGRAMEALIRDGVFVASADVTTTEWADEVVGGVLSAGPDRLGAAGEVGIPQVVSVGALDMVNFGPADTLPERFRGRTIYRHNPMVTLMRTTPDECREIARRIAGRLNEARGPVTVLLPLRGVSMLDREGQPFHDAEADRVLFATLKEELSPRIRVEEVDAHINDPAFARALAAALLEQLKPD